MKQKKNTRNILRRRFSLVDCNPFGPTGLSKVTGPGARPNAPGIHNLASFSSVVISPKLVQGANGVRQEEEEHKKEAGAADRKKRRGDVGPVDNWTMAGTSTKRARKSSLGPADESA